MFWNKLDIQEGISHNITGQHSLVAPIDDQNIVILGGENEREIFIFNVYEATILK